MPKSIFFRRRKHLLVDLFSISIYYKRNNVHSKNILIKCYNKKYKKNSVGVVANGIIDLIVS